LELASDIDPYYAEPVPEEIAVAFEVLGRRDEAPRHRSP
jgi:hypothetical protein